MLKFMKMASNFFQKGKKKKQKKTVGKEKLLATSNFSFSQFFFFLKKTSTAYTEKQGFVWKGVERQVFLRKEVLLRVSWYRMVPGHKKPWYHYIDRSPAIKSHGMI